MGSVFHFFLWLNIPLYGHTTICSFIHLWAFGVFPPLAIMNSVATNMHAHAFVRDPVYNAFGYISRNRTVE